MVGRLLTRIATVSLALFILVVSLIETSSIKYAFGARETANPHPTPQVDVTYALPHPGSVMPGNPLWVAKVMRDKVSLKLTLDHERRAGYELHLADKRLAMGWELWLKADTNEAIATFEKAEGYLNNAYLTLFESNDFSDSHDFLRQLAYASLKHRQVLESVLAESSDEARPMITKLLDTSKTIYKEASAKMEQLHLNPPANPF